jgi:hypothetical protein
MSEFSISYHIRAGDDGHDVQKLLRGGKFSGITFGPANGWLTFVPYANSAAYQKSGLAGFADNLSRQTGRTVLHYCYAEDHGWTFALARADGARNQFACWWNPQSSVERDGFDPLALAPFIAPELLEPLLRPLDSKAAAKEAPAYRFAELLGLPAYRWLSPDIAQNDTQALIDQGGRKLGTKPQGTAARLEVPPPRRIALPHPYLTAREALDLISPFMGRYRPPWGLTMLSSYGFIRSDGRGVWQARWRYGGSGDMVQSALFDDGRLSFRADSAPSYTTGFLLQVMKRPERWLDSTEIASTVARLPVPGGVDQPSLGIMTLRSFEDHPHVWDLGLQSDPKSNAAFVSWKIHVDAVSGDVLSEQLCRKDGYMIVPARQRRKGGNWEELG